MVANEGLARVVSRSQWLYTSTSSLNNKNVIHMNTTHTPGYAMTHLMLRLKLNRYFPSNLQTNATILL